MNNLLQDIPDTLKQELLLCAHLLDNTPDKHLDMAIFQPFNRNCPVCAMSHIMQYPPCESLKPTKEDMLGGTGMSFREYFHNHFGAFKSDFYEIRQFLFSEWWEKIDNTPEGAAARFRFVAEWQGSIGALCDRLWGQKREGKAIYQHLIKGKATA